MTRVLLLFVDGIGLGLDDPAINPFAAAHLPTLHALTNGRRWLHDTGIQQTPRSVFIPTDPRLGVPGRPQSGSSQAAILTGINVPARLGRHYGPKPDEQTRTLLTEDNLFQMVKAHGKTAALLDAYPAGLLDSIARGKTLPSSIQYAALAAGQPLFGLDDLLAGHALTAEWTGHAWREHLKIMETPLHTPQEAGRLIVDMSREYTFAMHSHWLTDYIGHRGPFGEAVNLLQMLDGVIEGVLGAWNDDDGLVLLTSDHGNLEHIGDRHHTENDVPTLIIGRQAAAFAEGFVSLTDFVPHILRFLFG